MERVVSTCLNCDTCVGRSCYNFYPKTILICEKCYDEAPKLFLNQENIPVCEECYMKDFKPYEGTDTCWMCGTDEDLFTDYDGSTICKECIQKLAYQEN